MTRIRLNQPTIKQIIKGREYIIVKSALSSLEGSIEGNEEDIPEKIYQDILDLSKETFKRYQDIFLMFELASEDIDKFDIELHSQIIFYVSEMQDHLTIRNNLNRIRQLLSLYSESIFPHIYKDIVDTIEVAERKFKNIDQTIMLFQERLHYNNLKKLTFRTKN